MTQCAETETIRIKIVIQTQDFERTLWFYRDALGLVVCHEGDGYAHLSAGGVNIVICSVDPGSELIPASRSMYLSLVVADLEQIEDRLLTARGILLEKMADGHIIRACDPSGNLVELTGSRPSEDKRVSPVHLKMKMLISGVAQMLRAMDRLVGHLGAIGASEELSRRIHLLQVKLRETYDYAKQEWGNEPSSEEQELAEEVSYQELRAAIAELRSELYELVNAIAQCIDTTRADEMHEVLIVKSLLEDFSKLLG